MATYRNLFRVVLVGVAGVITGSIMSFGDGKEVMRVHLDAPYGRAVLTRAVGKSLENNGVTGYKRVLGEAGAATAARSLSEYAQQSCKSQPVDVAQFSKNAAMYFATDGGLRAIEQQAAHYGISSKKIAKKAKKFLPEIVGDFVEAIAPTVGEVVHQIVCDSVTQQVSELTK